MRCLFIQCQRYQAPPFNFPTIKTVQSPAQFGRTAPPLRKATVYPARQGVQGATRPSLLVLGSSLFPVFFLFFFFLSLAQKEKAVVLEDPVPHRTECTHIAYIVQNPLLPRPCTSACSTQHNYGKDTRAPESSSRGHWRLDRLNSFHDSASGPGPWVFVSFHRLGVCASRHPVCPSGQPIPIPQ